MKKVAMAIFQEVSKTPANRGSFLLVREGLAFFLNICYDVSTMLKKNKKQTVIKKVQKHEKDTGSSQVQIAILSERIDSLASHLKKHKQDAHSRRGLIKMVADRRTHLKYLERKDKPSYEKTLKSLKIS